jgi:hypothetical protein
MILRIRAEVWAYQLLAEAWAASRIRRIAYRYLLPFFLQLLLKFFLFVKNSIGFGLVSDKMEIGAPCC